MTVPINQGHTDENAFLEQAQERDRRFEDMPSMEGAGAEAQHTSVPGGPPTGRHVTAHPRSSAEIVAEIQEKQRAIEGRSPALQELRERMDDRNTDKSYRSRQNSALGQQFNDCTTMREGEQPTPNTFRATGTLADLDERNTNRYYKDQLIRGKTRQQIEHEQRQQAVRPQPGPSQNRGAQMPGPSQTPNQGSQTQPVHHAQSVHPLEVRAVEDVRKAVDRAVELLKSGQTRVVIRVTGPMNLVMRTQTYLDGLVTREILTEDQYRDVKIDTSYAGTADLVKETRTPDQAFGKPVPAATPATPEKPLGDPKDFLNAPDEVPEGSQAVPTMPAKPDLATEGEDNDFLGGVADTVSPPMEPSTPAAPASAPDRKLRSRKH